MKYLHKKLIDRWRFKLFPLPEVCAEVDYTCALKVSWELHADDTSYDNPDLRRILVPRNDLLRVIQGRLTTRPAARRR